MPLKAVKRPGRRYYTIVGTVAGRRIYKSAKTSVKSIADKKARALEIELEDRAILGPAAVMTFAQAYNEYVDAGNSDRFLKPLLDKMGRMKMKDIKQSTLDRVAREIYPDVKPSTLNRHAYTPFIAVFRHVADDLDINRNWRRPSGHNKRTRFRWLWPHDIERIHKVMPPHWQAVVDVLVGTGLRESEAIRLDWLYTSLNHGEAWIHETKTSPERKIELPPRTVATLATLKHRKGPVLLNRLGKPFKTQETGGGVFRTGLEYYCKKAGVEPFGSHTLRHTWATWFYSWNRDVLRLKQLGGWSGDQMVSRYTHIAPRNMREDLMKYGWSFDGNDQERLANKVL